MGFVVAVDGPAGSGKGTVTKLIAEKENLVSIDTGAMYRCVALECINNNVKEDEINKIEKILEKINIEFKNVEGVQKVFLNGKDVTTEIRETNVNNVVAKFAAVKCVRDKVTPMERQMAKSQNIIMEGRDIGTVVFPNADVKIYLDCSVEERAKRRHKQNIEKGINSTYEEVLESIKQRNKLETEREIAPLRQAEDAIYIDSSNLTIEQVVEKISLIINNARKD